MNKKQVKSYTLSEETITAIESYSKISGNSQSQSVENLILNGLENINSIKNLNNKITQEFKNFSYQNRKDIDRLISIIIGQTRSIGKIYGAVVTGSVRSGNIKQEELEDIFNSGIKKVMGEFKNNHENVGRKDYE
ncbi:hypothetical protein [Arcobacter cloacae]|uniref:Uncharacterized protein n=1 Tax=Arcobacter cloacae TaxID=1054034 RepID=A0A4Q0ZBD9_9BACT|nr:hypothetical protein [Arcobacter cloacae]RXJ83577.1 hypothetical protein CRU90_09310 [Arcobacter cloacae]